MDVFQEDSNDQIGYGDQLQSLDDLSVTKYPYNCIGYLTIIYNNVLMTGTGFLIAPDLVLTVAHNVYFRNNKKSIDASKISFYPGISQFKIQSHLKRPYKIDNLKFPDAYKICSRQDTCNYDYALLKLQEKVIRSQYIQLGFDYSQMGEKIGLYGYQTQMCQLNNRIIQTGIWKSDSHKVQNNNLFYKISTNKGNSGSPVLCKTKDQRVYAIGIHKGHSNSKQFNKGILINDKMISDLVKWQKEMYKSKIKINLSLTNNIQRFNLKKTQIENICPQNFIQKIKIHQDSSKFYKNFTWEIPQKLPQYFGVQNKMVSKNRDGYYQITSKIPIPINSITSIKVKLHKYGKRHGICIGLITQNRKKEQWNGFDDNQSIGYWSSTQNKKGCIIIDGKQVLSLTNDLFLSVGSQLLIIINTIQYQLTFCNVSRQKEWICQLKNQHWRLKNIYLSLGMPSEGACLQLIK